MQSTFSFGIPTLRAALACALFCFATEIIVATRTVLPQTILFKYAAKYYHLKALTFTRASTIFGNRSRPEKMPLSE
jgi:hypothetical protein